MSPEGSVRAPRRREQLPMTGLAARGAAMHQAMGALRFAQVTRVSDKPGRQGATGRLGADPRGRTRRHDGRLRAASCRIRRADARITTRPGGRNRSLRGGDCFTEFGGATPECQLDPGLYINPGSWRIAYPTITAICSGAASHFGVALEPYIQINYNCYSN